MPQASVCPCQATQALRNPRALRLRAAPSRMPTPRNTSNGHPSSCSLSVRCTPTVAPVYTKLRRARPCAQGASTPPGRRECSKQPH
eukprot:2286214-Alexandrium_andersonii.AAC.1